MIAALLAFALAATLLILAPGPDSLLVMRNTLRNGRRAGWVTAGGTLSGLLIWVVAAAVGLSALLRVSHIGYEILRLAGAGYLIWLGASGLGLLRRKQSGLALRRKRTGRQAEGSQGRLPDRAVRPVTGVKPSEPASPGPARFRCSRAYLSGMLSNLLNPKIGVFFIAFLPGFIPAGAPTAEFSLVLGLWFIVETGAWLVTLAWGVARGAGWLRRPAVLRWLERGTGIVLIGFGLRLASQSR
jgi:threonine/homoserine/homoserine lactone efflux protein